ncbi:cytochrome c oxidase subunit 4 [Microlunatus sp. Y2014]|uniref:cytochrome c oxidase subunit 4 n=1 Tax=Microlunatus sp. Y2014 TaxID=3418488 RepID=UPI003DA6FD09
MRMESFIFAVLVIFFAIVAPVYWFMSGDPTGTTALALTFGVCLMLGGYTFLLARNLPKRPEDRKDGEIVEGAGELGFFPPSSIWPLYVALTASLIALGPVFGWWLALIGMALGIAAVAGWLYQYYRGEFAH